MFGFFKKFNGLVPTTPTFEVVPVQNDRFAIADTTNGTIVKTYSRRSDAVRGANRLGLNIA